MPGSRWSASAKRGVYKDKVEANNANRSTTKPLLFLILPSADFFPATSLSSPNFFHSIKKINALAMSGWRYAFALSKQEVAAATPPGTARLLVATIWCAVSTSYNSVLAARVVQGMGAGASETIAPAVVGEVFFVDERGRAMAVYTVFLCAGSIVGGVAGGYIGFSKGWAHIFWVGVAISAFCFVCTILFVPETLYDRVVSPVETAPGSASSEKGTESQVEDSPSQVLDYRPYTFGRSLGFTHFRGNVVSNFMAPWKTLRLPGTWVVMFHYAGLVGGIVTISVVGPEVVAAPPYLWGNNVGLINIGGLVGILLGALYTYLLSDALLKKKVKSSGSGLAEPESRLPIMFLALAVATSGFFVFGFCGQYPSKNGWVGLCTGYAMVSFGLMQLPSAGFNYVSLSRPVPAKTDADQTLRQLIDAYKQLAGDCFVMVTIMRSIIAFAWTFFVAQWVEERGPAEPFGIFGMLMGIFSLLTIPLWLFGKRIRIATSKHVKS
ncbi:putative major facilitator superfamily transporter [Colletotrichum sublineola]|uniref:Putative major facilitator superfamily transporter n=1 Tax=Colletotrichum sublineola TaxID=1173701 RepID=A0A066X7J5_COLSU|nr:putative major facilitator superfamily transporter [Colletotrichum sublineola]